MASFSDATITSMTELIAAIDTFLTGSAGFTQDDAPGSNNVAWNAASAGGDTGELFVQVDYTSSDSFLLYQSEGYTGPNNPGDEDNDSNYIKDVDFFGVTITSAEVFGFANNATKENERYAHFVVEFNRDGRFIHFGFGHMDPADKLGNWDGGAYVYGGEWAGSTPAPDPTSQSHRFLLDSNHGQVSTTQNLSTMTCRNHDNSTSGARYVAFTTGTGAMSNDQDANAIDRAEGWARYGPWPGTLLNYRGNPNNAAIFLVPVEVAIRGTLSATQTTLLGRMPDLAVCNIGNIQAKQSITIGGDTWKFFPWAQKLTGAPSGTMGSRNAGVAYKVIP